MLNTKQLLLLEKLDGWHEYNQIQPKEWMSYKWLLGWQWSIAATYCWLATYHEFNNYLQFNKQ